MLKQAGELYGKNNPFQRSGPKGAVERIALKNDKLYMRVDMPGVPKQNMSCYLDHFNNVIFTGLAPKEWEHGDQVREYGGLYGLRCGCCEVAKLHGNITNGVLRMKMSKVYFFFLNSCLSSWAIYMLVINIFVFTCLTENIEECNSLLLWSSPSGHSHYFFAWRYRYL